MNWNWGTKKGQESGGNASGGGGKGGGGSSKPRGASTSSKPTQSSARPVNPARSSEQRRAAADARRASQGRMDRNRSVSMDHAYASNTSYRPKPANELIKGWSKRVEREEQEAKRGNNKSGASQRRAPVPASSSGGGSKRQASSGGGTRGPSAAGRRNSRRASTASTRRRRRSKERNESEKSKTSESSRKSYVGFFEAKNVQPRPKSIGNIGSMASSARNKPAASSYKPTATAVPSVPSSNTGGGSGGGSGGLGWKPAQQRSRSSGVRPVSARHMTDSEDLRKSLLGSGPPRATADHNRRKSTGVLEVLEQTKDRPKVARPLSMKMPVGGESKGEPKTIDDFLDRMLLQKDVGQIHHYYEQLKMFMLNAVEKKGGKPNEMSTIDQLMLTLTMFKKKRLVQFLKDRQTKRAAVRAKKAREVKVVVVGGGPVGLRSALEAWAAGASSVHVVERRTQYVRNNALLMWESTVDDLSTWGVRQANVEIAGKTHPNIRIQELERFLLRICLLCDVTVEHGVEFKKYSLGPGMAHVVRNGREAKLPFDLIVGVEGQKSIVREQAGIKFESIGKGRDIYGLTCNFEPPTKSKITEEIFESDEIISGSKTAGEKYRHLLNGIAKLLHLPNPSTWYLAMEPTPEAAKMLRDASKEQLHNFCREIGAKLGIETPLVEVAFFEVHIMRSNIGAVVQEKGGQLSVVDLEGDSLSTPFWYLGTGINKSYMSVWDLGSMIKDMLTTRDYSKASLNKMCQTKTSRFKHNLNQWSSKKK